MRQKKLARKTGAKGRRAGGAAVTGPSAKDDAQEPLCAERLAAALMRERVGGNIVNY
jgi:hypothetical protein